MDRKATQVVGNLEMICKKSCKKLQSCIPLNSFKNRQWSIPGKPSIICDHCSVETGVKIKGKIKMKELRIISFCCSFLCLTFTQCLFIFFWKSSFSQPFWLFLHFCLSFLHFWLCKCVLKGKMELDDLLQIISFTLLPLLVINQWFLGIHESWVSIILFYSSKTSLWSTHPISNSWYWFCPEAKG